MPEDVPDPPKSSKMKLLVPVFALLVGAVGAVAVAKPSLVGLADGAAAVEGEAPPPPAEYGEFMQLEGIVVNPKGSGGRRYLMVKLGVEAEDAGPLDRLGDLKPAAIDAVIDVLGSEPVERLADIALRDSLKEGIRSRFNAMLGDDGPVTRIYFTQYVLQ